MTASHGRRPSLADDDLPPVAPPALEAPAGATVLFDGGDLGVAAL